MRNLDRVALSLSALACLFAGLQPSPQTETRGHPGETSSAAGRGRAPAVVRAALSSSQGAGNPHGEIAFSCSACHTTEGWTPVRDPMDFDHADAGYALTGNHVGPDCGDCHESLVFAAVATACADCHADIHRGEMGFECSTCHSEVGWSDRREMFIFHFTTSFPLLGGHAALDCESCHRAAPPFEFSSTPTDCYSCHAEDYRQTADPEHAVSGFDTVCESCHSIDSWRGALIPEHTFFPLRGGHAYVPCASCHESGFSGAPTDCYACHADDYRRTREPDHEVAGFPTDCAACHTIDDWDADFEHDAFFPLVDAHALAECDACHVDSYAGTPSDCYSCHAAEYDATTDPEHRAAQFPTECDLCHDQRKWEGAVFEHESVFQLLGAHRRLDCDACHIDGYRGTPTDCYSCHTSDYRAATDPDHSGLPRDCETCHDQRDWSNAVFDHTTFFALQGAHRTLDCESCHLDGYAGTSTDCYDCHTADYASAADPDHTTFPRDCQTCHDQRDWNNAVFDHAEVFPLQGAHRTLDCETCHTSGYSGTPADCFGCHASEYRETTDPNHRAAGFPTDCAACHDQSRWEGAVFDHNAFYPLQGAHRSLDCSACHATGYANTASDCVSCHLSDYRATSNPDHQAAGFPTSCDACHDQSTWEGAVFDHRPFFPIYSGAHNGEWNTCADCHVQPSDYGVFECINCHEHSQSEMAGKHREVSGYQWLSTACYSCHPQGREDN